MLIAILQVSFIHCPVHCIFISHLVTRQQKPYVSQYLLDTEQKRYLQLFQVVVVPDAYISLTVAKLLQYRRLFMFSTLLNVIKTPSQRTSLECDDTPKSPLSQAIHGLDSLHLTDDLSIPGSFSPGLSMVSNQTAWLSPFIPTS